MIELKMGDYVTDSTLPIGTIFRFITPVGTFVLHRINAPIGSCMSCGFSDCEHRLSSLMCTDHGLPCKQSTYRDVENIMEEL
jgi:hypothetical protein